MTEPAQYAEYERRFEAFVAGFNVSGEGWNGEYPYVVTGTDPTLDLRPMFEAWVRLIDGLEGGDNDL